MSRNSYQEIHLPIFFYLEETVLCFRNSWLNDREKESEILQIASSLSLDFCSACKLAGWLSFDSYYR